VERGVALAVPPANKSRETEHLNGELEKNKTKNKTKKMTPRGFEPLPTNVDEKTLEEGQAFT
jgi:hypothetical protein